MSSINCVGAGSPTISDQNQRFPKPAPVYIWTWAHSIWQNFSPEKELIFSQVNLGYALIKAKKFSHSNKIDGSFKLTETRRLKPRPDKPCPPDADSEIRENLEV